MSKKQLTVVKQEPLTVDLTITGAALKKAVEAVPPPTCSTCPFWGAGRENAKQGNCRRYAPEPNTCVTTATRWAITNESDWCGEHPDRRVS